MMSYETYYGHLLVWRFQHVPAGSSVFQVMAASSHASQADKVLFLLQDTSRDCKVTLDGSSHSFEGENLDR